MSDWERCKPFIEAALPYTNGTHAIEDIEQLLRTGKLALLAGERSALVLEIIHYPRCRHLHIFLIGGDLKEILSFNAALDLTAKLNGCSRITGIGRDGWGPALKQLGYAKCSTGFAKDMANV